MISSPLTPSEIKKTLLRAGWPRSGPEVAPTPANVRFQDDTLYTNPIDRHLYDEPKELGGDRKNDNPPREQEQDNGHYEPMENKETVVLMLYVY